MNLPKIADLDLKDKTVFIRLDLDVPLSDDNKILDDRRIRLGLPTIKKVLESGAKKVYLAGHVGRVRAGAWTTSTIIFQKLLSEELGEEVTFRPLIGEPSHDENLDSSDESEHKIVLYENVRTFNGEEEDSYELAQKFSSGVEVYINEAFAVSHRDNTSISALPKLIKNKGGKLAFGLRFNEEIENLSKILINPARPVLILLSGAKGDKLDYLSTFDKIADKIIVGGRFPLLIKPDQINTEKIIVSSLLEDTKDISANAIEIYKQNITTAATIVVSGPMGLFDDGVHGEGSKQVLSAVANSKAFKLAGGGDTELAISNLSLSDKFDWISVGGGAMLEFLANGTLPGIEALLN